MAEHPHCDSNILHRKNSCWAYDLYPDRQQARIDNKINFTGEYDSDKAICPSEQLRNLPTIERWPGNRTQGPNKPEFYDF